MENVFYRHILFAIMKIVIYFLFGHLTMIFENMCKNPKNYFCLFYITERTDRRTCDVNEQCINMCRH